MRRIPAKLREELSNDPYYKHCCLKHHACFGGIEFHHAMMYAGRQINEKWAILPLCYNAHSHISQFDHQAKCIAVSRATEEDKLKYPRLNWELYNNGQNKT